MSTNALALVLTAALLGGCLPQPYKYPYRPPQDIVAEAEALSLRLETHVKAYLDGNGPAAIPDSILPPGIDFADNQAFRVQRFEDIRPEDQWIYRPIHDVRQDRIYTGVPDPHCTYLKLGTSLAPFGSKLVMEGEFPHCRFFSVQISPPFDGKSYYSARSFGPTEVGIVDADITPLPGHTNPFLPGADRTATNRGYRLEFPLAIGDAVSLNPGHVPPYRITGNQRTGALLVHQGPWGLKQGKGYWNMGEIWMRYYAPDKAKGPLAGVPLPKCWYELPDGRRYYITSNHTLLNQRVNKSVAVKPLAPQHPKRYFGPQLGMYKSFGIMRSITSGILMALGKDSPANKAYARTWDKGITGRGHDLPGYQHYEVSATACNHISYLGRPMSAHRNRIVVFTGKMPTYPHTRDGAAQMTGAQMRYWSFSSYDVNPFSKSKSGVVWSVMDDEVVLDSNRYYIIVVSRPEDRPANATAANGVTWVNWGKLGYQGPMLRWMSVAPEWEMSPNPHERELSWEQADWASPHYNHKLIGFNTHNGHLGPYQPVTHYMAPDVFEALGSRPQWHMVPRWEKRTGTTMSSLQRK